jgi:hypothetical protein
MREARIGRPATAASETTFAPPSFNEEITMAWLRASSSRTAPAGTSPHQR